MLYTSVSFAYTTASVAYSSLSIVLTPVPPIGVYSSSSLLLIRFRRLLIACGAPLPLPIACGGGTQHLCFFWCYASPL